MRRSYSGTQSLHFDVVIYIEGCMPRNDYFYYNL